MKVDCTDFFACRILTLEVEAATKDCEEGNGLRYLTGNFFCSHDGSSQLLVKLCSPSVGIFLSGEENTHRIIWLTSLD